MKCLCSFRVNAISLNNDLGSLPTILFSCDSSVHKLSITTNVEDIIETFHLFLQSWLLRTFNTNIELIRPICLGGKQCHESRRGDLFRPLMAHVCNCSINVGSTKREESNMGGQSQREKRTHTHTRTTVTDDMIKKCGNTTKPEATGAK